MPIAAMLPKYLDRQGVGYRSIATVPRDRPRGAIPPFDERYGLDMVADTSIDRQPEIDCQGGDEATLIRMSLAGSSRLNGRARHASFGGKSERARHCSNGPKSGNHFSEESAATRVRSAVPVLGNIQRSSRASRNANLRL